MTTPGDPQTRTRILLDMRPASEGFSGIPQETRILFKRLPDLDGVELDGLIYSSLRVLPKGLAAKNKARRTGTPHKRAKRMARIVVALTEEPKGRVKRWRAKRAYWGSKLRSRLKRMSGSPLAITCFDPKGFEDFIWRGYFAKSLAAQDRGAIVGRNFRVSSTPWDAMFSAGKSCLSLGAPRYPVLDTSDYDIFIAQKPFAARPAGRSKMVIRYHDAIPVFMPQLIPEKTKHLRQHLDTLADNVRAGAWFSCISEATRQDLLTLFPEVADRAFTIHNMVSDSYFRQESAPGRVRGIIRSRLDTSSGWSPSFGSAQAKTAFYNEVLALGQDAKPAPYLLMVGTIEPRKNHLRLLAAWDALRTAGRTDLKLLVVGSMGWDTPAIEERFTPWLGSGDLFMLSAVPPADMRVLYRHATATVCPSLGEGFDYPGVEAMRCGGAVIASDLAVHREIYDDAALYFDPYSTSALVAALKQLTEEGEQAQLRAHLEQRGADVSSRYTPEHVLPQWQTFLNRVRKG